MAERRWGEVIESYGAPRRGVDVAIKANVWRTCRAVEICSTWKIAEFKGRLLRNFKLLYAIRFAEFEKSAICSTSIL
jgi:hypothetical protein